MYLVAERFKTNLDRDDGLFTENRRTILHVCMYVVLYDILYYMYVVVLYVCIPCFVNELCTSDAMLQHQYLWHKNQNSECCLLVLSQL